jgi:VWFA-related protein
MGKPGEGPVSRNARRRLALAPPLALVALLALRALAASGQDKAPEAQERKPPVFAREVEQVTVDVVVADKQGNPVTGLGKEDFTVTDEGQAQQIASFDVVKASGAGAEAPPFPAAGPGRVASRPRLVTNTTGQAGRGRLFVLVFDNLHMSPLNAQRAKAAMAAFLDKGVLDGDLVTLIATGGGAWWTTRMPEGRDDLLAMLKNLDGRRFPESAAERMTDYEAMRISTYQDTLVARRVLDRWQRYGSTTRQGIQNAQMSRQDNVVTGVIDVYVESRASEAYLKLKGRMQVTFAALERALKPLAQSRERKAVILVSEGFIYDATQEGFKQVTEAARRANASVYFVDTRGLEGLLGGYSAQFGAPLPERDLMAALADIGQEGEGTAALAADTGGFSVRNTNDFAAGVVRIGRESSSYYLLGYNAGEIPHDGRFRKVEVRVRGKGLVVRARRGYYAPSDGTMVPAKREAGDPDLQRALDSPSFLDEIPLRMTAYVLQETSLGQARVLVAADADVSRLAFQEVEGKATGFLDTLMVVAYRDSGEFQRNDQRVDLQRRAGAAATGPAWYSMMREFDLPPGGYQARLVVRDGTSRRIGSLAFEFEVPSLDQLRVSTPILTDTVRQPPGQAAPSPVLLARRTFAAGGSLYCRFDVFGMAKDNARGLPRVRAGHVLRRIDGAVISRTEPTWIEPTSLGALARLLQIPLEGMGPGGYELVLTVRDEVSGQLQELREPFTLAQGAGSP